MFGSLNILVNMLAQLESCGIAVEAKRCARLRHRLASCTRCSNVCPTEAIQWGEDALEVDPAKCTGCGACAAVCPTAALEARSPNDVQLRTAVQLQARNIGAVSFACDRYLKASKRDGSRIIKVPCIVRVDESILIDAVVAGAELVQMVEGACSSCPQSKAREVASKTAASSNALLAAWGKAALVQLVPDVSIRFEEATTEIRPAGGISRRSFFTLLKGETAGVASGAIAEAVGTVISSAQDTVQEPRGQMSLEEYPRHVPEKRLTLLSSLKKLGQPVAQKLETELWGRVEIAQHCTGCLGCVDFCPTGALAKFEQDDQIGISFRHSTCTNCMLCEDICNRAMRTECLEISHRVIPVKVLQGTPISLILKNKQILLDLSASSQDKLAKLLQTSVSSYGA